MDFSIFKPAAPSASSIAEALERARAGQSEAAERVTSAKAARDDLLLDGEPAALAAAEKALVTAREDVDRTAAVVATLEARHAAAVKAEKVAKVDAAGKAAEAADTELQRWWAKNGAGLRRILTEGNRLSHQLTEARTMLEFNRTITLQEVPDAVLAEFAGGSRDHREWKLAVGNLVDLRPSRSPASMGAPVVEALPPKHAFGPGTLSMGRTLENDPGGSLSRGSGWQREARASADASPAASGAFAGLPQVAEQLLPDALPKPQRPTRSLERLPEVAPFDASHEG